MNNLYDVNQLIHITNLQDLFTNETDLILESVIRLQQLTVISVNNNLNLCLFLKQIYDMTSEDSNNSTSHMGHFYSVLCLFLNLIAPVSSSALKRVADALKMSHWWHP